MRLWNRKLPTGKALLEEADRLGVSMAGLPYPTWKDHPELHSENDPELQSRVLAAWSHRRDVVRSWVQTIAIVGALFVTLFFSMRNRSEQVNQTSGDFMLRFDDKLNEGGSGMVAKALDRGDRLAGNPNVSDDDIGDFLSKYELLAPVYRADLINRDMAYTAFSYELEKALKDPRVRQYLVDSRREEPDLFDGVRELSRAWGIKNDLTVAASPTSQPSPTSPARPSAAH